MLSMSLKLFAQGQFFQFYKVFKPTQLKVSKLCQVVSNSGFIIAGCCFSRQSDEDSLISKVKKDHANIDPSAKLNDPIYSNSSALNDKKSNIMKRSSGFSQIIISQDSNIVEIVAQDQNVSNKKRKIIDEETESDKKDETHLSDTANESQACINIEPQVAEKKEFFKSEKKDLSNSRPNYFVAVKVSNQEIHENLKDLQNDILKKEFNLKRSMLELKTLHITLMVMYIGDAETHKRAMKALKSVHEEHDMEMSNNPLDLEFKGLGHFQNRVLFAKISHDDSYERLCNLAESVKKHFAANEIFSTDKRSQFTPHLTVAKIDFKKRQNRFIKKIDPGLYKDYADSYFGSQKIESIQLLSMTNPKNEEGYYSGDEIYFSSFDPNTRLDTLSKLLKVEQKKKDIKEAINSLMKEKLK